MCSLLIKSGGGTGPVKPGNLQMQGANSREMRRSMRVRSLGDEGVFLCQMCILSPPNAKKGANYGKQTFIYL